MPDESELPPPDATPYQKWLDKMYGDLVILKLSGRIMDCVRKIEETDEEFDKTRKHLFDLVADAERWSHKLDQAIEDWKIRKQDLFCQHVTTPLMDRGNKAAAKYIQSRRYRSVSLRSQDPARVQAKALLDRMERESAETMAQQAATQSPPPDNESPTSPSPASPEAQ